MDEPDGINDIIDSPPPMEIPLMIDPMADLGHGRADQADLRDIMVRRNKLEIAAGESITILDERESGELNYVILQATADSGDLADGGTPANAEKLALFLQLDGFAQGGLESHYHSGTGKSFQGITIEDVTTLGMPEQYGNWFLKQDTSTLKVAMFRGLRPYRHRIRLKVTNLQTTGTIFLKFVEISRRRYTNLDGHSNARGLLGQPYGF